MIDLDILSARGVNEENLKKKLSVDLMASMEAAEGSDEAKVQRLLRRIQSRIQEGQNQNFENYKIFHAIDMAWETPFRQITPTLVQSLLDKSPNEKEVYDAVQEWGLANLIEEKPDPKDPSKKVKSFNWPVFVNVLIPIVRSYCTIRWAKICNDRAINPFFKFEPLKLTTPLSLMCEALTDRIAIMSNQLGYYDVMKQSVLKMLQYGFCLLFVMEEWYSEEQLRRATEEDVLAGKKNIDGEPASVGDLVKFTDKEGLRYHDPHPCRSFRDMAYKASMFNSDSGPTYGGYWRITRYKEILESNFWNRDKIGFGKADVLGNHRTFFTTVYPCNMAWPKNTTPEPTGASLGAGANDRENKLSNYYYGSTHEDAACMVTEYFEKLNPKENGLGDYDGLVWFRFVVAGDSATVLYAAPLPYCPIVYYGYDADESRALNPGMAAETLPFQDHFSNVMTQIILTAKQNLANLTLVDGDQLPSTTKADIENLGQQTYEYLNIFEFSSKQAARLLQTSGRLPSPIQSFSLPKGNVAELIAVSRQILEVLERVMVMSSQELGQAASHELRADEVRNIQVSTSTRLAFTATPVDIARDAWKRQLYQALMAYGDDDIYLSIPAETPLTKAQLESMGFTFLDRDAPVRDRYLRARTKKSRIAVPLWSIASVRDGQDRTDNEKLAVGMSQVVMNLLNNPMTAQAIGTDQAIDLANRICQLAGLPRDLKLRNMAPDQQVNMEQQQAEAQAQLKEVVDAVMQNVEKQLEGANKKMESSVEPVVKDVSELKTMVEILYRALNLTPPNAGN